MKQGFVIRQSIHIYATNVAGVGATRLVQSLLPELERSIGGASLCIHLPNRGELSTYQPVRDDTVVSQYIRRMPNSISRFFECLWFSRQFDRNDVVIVLGDIPLRCSARQTVFVHTPNVLAARERFDFSFDGLKYWMSRLIFRINQSCAQAYIVQSEVMREALVRTYPNLEGRVHVLLQPAPQWMLSNSLVRQESFRQVGANLKLFYPAANYPHKNHSLLSSLPRSAEALPIDRLVLTIDQSINPAPRVSWVQCAGLLTTDEMADAYLDSDALVFLSKKESYGLPLVEAMYVGKPIVCPDLPYARFLCEDQAIYFCPDDPNSLLGAIDELRRRIDSGWKPDWGLALAKIPSSWAEVGDRIFDISYVNS